MYRFCNAKGNGVDGQIKIKLPEFGKSVNKFKFKFFIDMKSNKGLSSATIQSTDIHKA